MLFSHCQIVPLVFDRTHGRYQGYRNSWLPSGRRLGPRQYVVTDIRPCVSLHSEAASQHRGAAFHLSS